MSYSSLYFTVVAVVLPLLTSCVVEPPEAKKMTFVKAMEDLSAGMRVLKDGAPVEGGKHLGLVPTEVTATFELTSTSGNELGVNLAAAPSSNFSSASANVKNTQILGRKNTVTVTLKNVYVDKDGKLRGIQKSDIPDGMIVPLAPIGGALE
jgi:hypothetical protein